MHLLAFSVYIDPKQTEMNPTNPLVDLYLADGCGRCARYKTADCSTQHWRRELSELRTLALQSGLTEELKWKHPCYTLNGKNVVILGAFREYCVMTFLKGSIMGDPAQILEFQGENSQIAKSARIRKPGSLGSLAETLKAYLAEAIELEKSGAKVERAAPGDFPIPEELAAAFEESPEFHDAFRSLSPGRQRSYIIFISGAKQAKTREARVEKSMDGIYAGKGHNEY